MSSFLLKGTFYGEVKNPEIKFVMENVTNSIMAMQKYILNTKRIKGHMYEIYLQHTACLLQIKHLKMEKTSTYPNWFLNSCLI